MSEKDTPHYFIIQNDKIYKKQWNLYMHTSYYYLQSFLVTSLGRASTCSIVNSLLKGFSYLSAH